LLSIFNAIQLGTFFLKLVDQSSRRTFSPVNILNNQSGLVSKEQTPPEILAGNRIR